MRLQKSTLKRNHRSERILWHLTKDKALLRYRGQEWKILRSQKVQLPLISAFNAAVPSGHKRAESPGREKIGLIINVEAQNQFLSRISFGEKRNLLLLSDDFQPIWDGFLPAVIMRRSKRCILSGYAPLLQRTREHTITSYALTESNFTGQVKEVQKKL